MNDEYQLQRFLTAQNRVYAEALAMLRGGMMCTQYMDFIFPRLADPGASPGRYAISSLDEARAYLAFPVLGDRYRKCIGAMRWFGDVAATAVFGDGSAKKLHSSLTLFTEATNEVLFRTMLAVWFDNMVDEETIIRLDLVS